jgi:hypothetical protein
MRFGRAAKGVSDARVVPQCCICDVRQEAPIVGERPLWGTRHYDRLWPVSDRRIRRSLTRLHLGLLGDLQCIVDLDSEIPNGAFEFGMAEEKLNGPEISCSPIDQRGFRPAK